MKNRNYKYDVALLSGIALGAIGGILLAPNKGQSLRSKIVYKVKKSINRAAKFIISTFETSNNHIVNEAKSNGNEIIKNTRQKALQLLEDLKKIT